MSSQAPGPRFNTLGRQKFRTYFQPSRVVLGLLGSRSGDRPNVITLCFNMYCSYKPPMMAFAVHKAAFSFELLEAARECVLAVPGERLAEQSMYCGITSGREESDKFLKCGFTPSKSEHISVPGIQQAIANIELELVDKVLSGDHITVFGRVLKFGVNESNQERCLVSVGARTYGYRVLVKKGVHRIAVVNE